MQPEKQGKARVFKGERRAVAFVLLKQLSLATRINNKGESVY